MKQSIAKSNQKILENVAKIEKDPQRLLTVNMGGKMEGFDSISTSCKVSGGLCEKRIAWAIKKIREFSPEAAAIIDRYLLPSKDPRHITGTVCANMLKTINCPVCVCIFCFADRAQDFQDNAREKFLANTEYLKIARPADQLPMCAPRLINGVLPFRFEAEGDIQNAVQMENYLTICNKPAHKLINFALWSKNPGFVWAAVKRAGGKPENLQIVLSSRFLNDPDTKIFNYYNKLCRARFGYDLFNKLFTVYTQDALTAAGGSFNCCGSGENKDRRCGNCLNCYKPGGNVFVNELLR